MPIEPWWQLLWMLDLRRRARARQYRPRSLEVLMKTPLARALGAVVFVCVLPRPAEAQKPPVIEYLVLATNRTSTMEKEVQEGGSEVLVIMRRDGGMTMGGTTAGVPEVVAILKRKR